MKSEIKTSKNTAPRRSNHIKGKVSKVVKDYGNDPFFVKKSNASHKFLEEHGFPNLPSKK